MMIDTSVDAQAPPGQARILGEYCPTKGTRLTLREESGETFLIRPSAGSRAGTDEDIAAFVHRNGDTVEVEWNDWHRQHQPVWMPSVEDWVREILEAEA